MTGYDRDRFGDAWLDADRNGCDTRNDRLGARLTHVSYAPGTGGCKVLSGILADPYTGQRIHFVYGDGALVDIDHVVALGNAWVTGAFRWDIKKRAALANDPLNLLPVDASANRQKGDADAGTWLPPNKPFRCAYVARQISVKTKYRLWVTPSERDAMRRVLSRCQHQPLTADPTHAPTLAPLNITDPGPEPEHTATPVPTHSDGGKTDPRFDYCYQAQDHGYGPYVKGRDAEYAWYTDNDGDGTVCE